MRLLLALALLAAAASPARAFSAARVLARPRTVAARAVAPRSAAGMLRLPKALRRESRAKSKSPKAATPATGDAPPPPPPEPSLSAAAKARAAAPVPAIDDLRASLRANLEKEHSLDEVLPALMGVARTAVPVIVVALTSYATLPLQLNLVGSLTLPTDVTSVAQTNLLSVFLAGVSIVFGTLISMTANVQRARQLNIRDVMYREIAALDALSHVLAKLYQRDPRRLLQSQAAVFKYCELFRDQLQGEGVLSEARARTFFAQRTALGTIQSLLAPLSDREMGLAPFNFSPGTAHSDLDRAWGLISDIQQHQASRSANLEHLFPLSWYALIICLASCLPFSFLLVLLWGAPAAAVSVAMRILYGGLMAVIAAIINFLLDMEDPFNGIGAIQPRRLRVVQAGIVNYMSRAQDGMSLEDYIKGYSSLWSKPGTAMGPDELAMAMARVAALERPAARNAAAAAEAKQEASSDDL